MHKFLFYNKSIILLYMFRALLRCVMQFFVDLVLPNFDVLLTVHLSIILVINQLDA